MLLKIIVELEPSHYVERKTSFTVSTRVDDKSTKTVTAATIALLAPLKMQC
jgi:hypothetical protein